MSNTWRYVSDQPIELNDMSIPVDEHVKTTTEHHGLDLDRSADFAQLVMLVKEQAQLEDESTGMFIDGEFTRACPISRSTFDPEKQLAFLKHIEDIYAKPNPMKPDTEKKRSNV